MTTFFVWSVSSNRNKNKGFLGTNCPCYLDKYHDFFFHSIRKYILKSYFIFFSQDDVRRYIALSTFGFYKGGILDVKLHNFQVDPDRQHEIVCCFLMFGFEPVWHYSSIMNVYISNINNICRSLDWRWIRPWATQWIHSWMTIKVSEY